MGRGHWQIGREHWQKFLGFLTLPNENIAQQTEYSLNEGIFLPIDLQTLNLA